MRRRPANGSTATPRLFAPELPAQPFRLARPGERIAECRFNKPEGSQRSNLPTSYENPRSTPTLVAPKMLSSPKRSGRVQQE